MFQFKERVRDLLRLPLDIREAAETIADEMRRLVVVRREMESVTRELQKAQAITGWIRFSSSSGATLFGTVFKMTPGERRNDYFSLDEITNGFIVESGGGIVIEDVRIGNMSLMAVSTASGVARFTSQEKVTPSEKVVVVCKAFAEEVREF
jgi:hypothetical protein